MKRMRRLLSILLALTVIAGSTASVSALSDASSSSPKKAAAEAAAAAEITSSAQAKAVQEKNSIKAASFNEQGVTDFVTRLYDICIGRKPDAKGLADWTGQLKDKKATGVSVAFGFIFSPEFQGKGYTNEEYVEIMYSAFFGRKSDPAGKADWLSKMNNGMSREDLFFGFANSKEFFNLCGSYGITCGCYIKGKDFKQTAKVNLFVERLYNVILGRSCDQGGMQDWSNRLSSGKISGAQAAYGFFFSTEYKSKFKSMEDYIEDLYMAFMGRNSDPAGKQNWLYVYAFGNTDRDVFNGFVGSQEFTGICSSYGIVRGDPVTTGDTVARGGVPVPVTPTPEPTPAHGGYEDASKYSYEITPMISGISSCYFVKTDNPDPQSFRFIDVDAPHVYGNYSYYDEYDLMDASPLSISWSNSKYINVDYEDTETLRVNGGYIFHNDSSCYYCDINGGTFKVQQRENGSRFSDTGITVKCETVKDPISYILDQTSGTFFERLSQYQDKLTSLSVYPFSVADRSRQIGYPGIRRTLNVDGYLPNVYVRGIYGKCGTFLEYGIDPYVLSSASFPAMVKAAALRLDPNCTITKGGTHEMIRITSGGVTRSYGGAGRGWEYGLCDLYKDQIKGKVSPASLAGSKMENISATVFAYKQMVAGNESDIIAEVEKTYKNNVWITLMEPDPDSDGHMIAFTGRGTGIFCDTWVDGRYVNSDYYFSPGKKTSFSEHPNSDIVLTGKTYTDQDGVKHTNSTLCYKYISQWDAWVAYDQYFTKWVNSTDLINKYTTASFPSEFVLTRPQAKSLIDKAFTSSKPSVIYRYDGDAEPGTRL